MPVNGYHRVHKAYPMKIKTCIVVLLSMAAGKSLAEMFPALIDPNNPAGLAKEIPKPPPAAQQPPTITQTPKTPALTPDTPIEVRHLQFIGGTRYPLPELAAPFAPYVGKKVTLRTLIAAANDITRRYHDDGYVLSYAYLPADNFHQGTLKIGLVEGYVANTRIHSENQAVGRWLTKLSQRIMAEKPLTQDTFDRYTLLMSRTPDTKVTASANNPGNIYGAAQMEVDAQRTRNWNVITSFDARKGDTLGIVNATLSGLTAYGEQLGIAALVPLDKDTRKTYFGLNYQQYLNDDGLMMQLKGSYYQQDPRDYTTLLTLPGNISLDTREKQTQYNGGVTFSYPLVLTRKDQWTLSGGLDYTDKRNDYRLRARVPGEEVDLPGISQHARYPAAELGLNGYHEFTQAYWNARVSVRQGIDAFGASDSGEPADLGFTRWKFSGDAAYLFAQKWRLSTAVEGDWSDNDLPEAERASFGAQRFGRGYQDGEATGDYGAGGQVEMRYLYNREFGPWLKTIQPYVLVDAAHTGFNRPGLPHQNLSSYAAGVTFGDNRHYTLSVEGARPIGDLPSDSSQRDWRFSLTFSYNFGAGS